jgi:glyceraldehyde-3-phosphate dehydrogenase (NADP+)
MAATYKFLIDGEWRTSPEKVAVPNRYSGDAIGYVYWGTAEDIEAAISAASKAFEATRRLATYERAEILAKIARTISERKEELARTMAAEAGKPIKAARQEVERAIFTFTDAGEETKRIEREYLPLDLLASSRGRFALVKRFPIGPITGITPFNFPLNLVAHKVAPVIASGNTLILKPAPQTPITALKLGEIITEAGYPKGGVNIVPCSVEVAQPLITDERIKMITFTGSVAAGWGIKAKSGRKRVALELGGNAGCVVHNDADLDFAAARTAVGGFSYAGQTCISVQRVYVHRDVYDDFLHILLPKVRALKVGDPLDEETDVGPMIDEAAAQRAESWVREAVGDGAQVLIGGGRSGPMMQPTVLVNVKPTMKVSCEEIFAPVITVEPYDDFKDAIARVNDSQFGLQAGIFTRDVQRIFWAYEELDVGGVMVNDVPTYRIDHMPYGGVKASGLGREGVKYAIREMTEQKVLVVNLE